MTEDYNISVSGKYNVSVSGIPDTPWGSMYAKVETPKMKYSKSANIKPDIFTSLGLVSKGSYKLFLELMTKTDPYTNICLYPTDSYTKSQKSAYNRNLSGLIKSGIYSRVKPSEGKFNRGTLMLNPYLFFANGDLGNARGLWETL